MKNQSEFSNIVSWRRIWGVVAKRGNITAELDRHVAEVCAADKSARPDTVRKTTINVINRAIADGRVETNLNRCAAVIDGAFSEDINEPI